MFKRRTATDIKEFLNLFVLQMGHLRRRPDGRVVNLFCCLFVFLDDVIVATLRQIKICENEQIMIPSSHRGYYVCMGGYSGEAEVRVVFFYILSYLFTND